MDSFTCAAQQRSCGEAAENCQWRLQSSSFFKVRFEVVFAPCLVLEKNFEISVVSLLALIPDYINVLFLFCFVLFCFSSLFYIFFIFFFTNKQHTAKCYQVCTIQANGQYLYICSMLDIFIMLFLDTDP